MSDIASKDVSDPLKHLFSLNFGRNSPVLDEVALNMCNDDGNSTHKERRRVSFMEPQVHKDGHPIHHPNPIKELKSILKNKLTFNETNLPSNTSTEHLTDDYSDDFSSAEDMSDQDMDFNDLQDEDCDSNSESYDKYSLESGNTFLVDSSSLSELSILKPKDTNMIMQVSDVANISSMKRNSHSPEVQQCCEEIPIHKSEMLLQTHDSNNYQWDSSNLSEKIPRMMSSENSISILPHVKLKKSTLDRSYHTTRPKLHCCVLSTLNEAKGQEDKFQGSMLKPNHQKGNHSLKRSISYCTKSADMNGISQETTKLKGILKDDIHEVVSAKELKSGVFNAWHKMKKEKASISLTTPKLLVENKICSKSQNSNISSEAFLKWKQKKDHVMQQKRKIREDTKKYSLSQEVVETKEKSKVYDLWKEKKDREIKEKTQQLHQKEKERRMNEFKAKELQKLEATSAFNAWVETKSKVEEKQKAVEMLKAETLKQKMEEKTDRSKEAQEAYFQWLEQKDEQRYQNDAPAHKFPPWNPPG